MALLGSRKYPSRRVLKTSVLDGKFVRRERHVSKVMGTQINFPLKLNALEQRHCSQ